MGKAHKRLGTGAFDLMHPRGADGQFIEKGALGALVSKHKAGKTKLGSAIMELVGGGTGTPGAARARMATGVKKPAKPIDPALKAKLDAIRKRPMPGDREFLERELKGLTVAQLEEVALVGNNSETPLPAGNKASKIQAVIEHYQASVMRYEAIVQGNHDAAGGGELNRANREFKAEFERRKKIAVERGDREEYAALVAGYGTAGSGPGLPPEKGASKWEAHLEGLAAGHKRDRELLASQLAGKTGTVKPKRARDMLKADAGPNQHGLRRQYESWEAARHRAQTFTESHRGASVQEKIDNTDVQTEDVARGLGIDVSAIARNRNGRPNRAAMLDAIADTLHPRAAPKSEPKRARDALKGADGGSGRVSAKDMPTAMAEIDALVANPKTEADRVRVKELLGRMTLPQIKQVADKHHNGLLVGGNKDEKVRRLADSIVGGKLDSAGIAGGIKSGAHATRVAALRGATDRDTARGWLTGLSAVDLKSVADDLGMPRGLARPSSKAGLSEAIVEFTAGNRANSAAIRGGVGDPPAAGSLAARQAAAKAQALQDAIEGHQAIMNLDKDPDSPLQRQLKERVAAAGRARAALSGKANLERLAGGPIKPGEFGPGSGAPRHSAKPQIPNQWGTAGGDVSFHPDGEIGTVIGHLSDEDRRLAVDGERLDNALGLLVTRSIRGQVHSSELPARLREIAAKLPEGRAKRAVQGAADDLAVDSAGREPIRFGSRTPLPLRRLAEQLGRVRGDRFNGDLELAALQKVIDDFEAGRVGGRRFEAAVKDAVHNRRHESQEGKFDVDRAAVDALNMLEEMRRANPRAFYPVDQGGPSVPEPEPFTPEEVRARQRQRFLEETLKDTSRMRPETRAAYEAELARLKAR